MRKLRFVSMVVFLLIFATICLFSCSLVGSEGAVELTATEDGITYSFNDHLSFVYATDGGSFTSVNSLTTIPFSEEEGDHTLLVNAVDPANISVILATATFTYKTVEIELSSIDVSGMTASWTAVGKATYLQVGDGKFEEYADSSYTATENGTITVRVVGGYDAEAGIFYAGREISDNAKLSRSTKKLSAPELVIGEEYISWNRVKNASSYAVSLDGGDYIEAESIPYSSVIGKHIVKVVAKGDLERYSDSTASQYAYTTAAASVSVTKVSSDRASFTFAGTQLAYKRTAINLDEGADSSEEGITVISKNGFDYCVFGEEYQATVTGMVTFAAMSGYDSKNKVYYPTDVETEVPFTVSAKEAVSLPVTEGWTSALNDSISIGKKYDASDMLLLSYLKDGEAYNYTCDISSLSLVDGYNVISFEAKGDALASVILLFSNSKDQIKLSYALGAIPAYWQSYKVSLEGEGWSVGEQKASEWIAALKADPSLVPEKYRHITSLIELVACFDRFEILLSANSPEASGVVAVSDLKFAYEEGAETSAVQTLFHRGNAYVLLESFEGESTDFYLSFDKDSFMIVSVQKSLTYAGTYSVDTAAATMELVGESFHIHLSFLNNGYLLYVDTVEGDVLDIAAKTFTLASELDLSFEDLESGIYNDRWSAYYRSPTSGEYVPAEKSTIYIEEVSSEEEETPSESAVLSFSTAYGEISRFVYNAGGISLGLANEFTVKLRNPNDAALELKWVAVALDGSEHYLIGTSTDFEKVGFTSVFVKYPEYLQDPVELSYFYFEIKNAENRENAYIYLSYIDACYRATASSSVYPAPSVIESNDSLTFTYPLSNVTVSYEYVLDGSREFESGEIADVFYLPENAEGEHVLYVRALVNDGEKEFISNVLAYYFIITPVYVDPIKVAIGEDKKHIATWSTNGKCSLRITKEVDVLDEETGEIVRGTEVVQDFTAIDMNDVYSATASEDVTFIVKSEGYFVRKDNKNVFVRGTVVVNKDICVSGSLDAPVLYYINEDGVDGIGWDAVSHADRYSVQVNDSVAIEQKERFYPFESSASEYLIKVISLDEDGIAYSNESVFTYRVVSLRNEDLVRKGTTFTGKIVGCRAFVSEKGDTRETELALSELSLDDYSRTFSYTAKGEGAHKVYIRVTTGFDAENGILYHGEDIVKSDTVLIERIPTPTIYPNKQGTGLTWKKDYGDGEVGYWVEEIYNGVSTVTEGNASFTEYTFKEAEGDYVLRVYAIGDEIEYLKSSTAEYAFTIRSISLAPQSVLSDGLVTLTLHSIALRTDLQADTNVNSNVYTDYKKDAYSSDRTVTVLLTSFGGFDAEERVYYAGETLTWTKKLIVPTPLQAPTNVQSNGSGVIWQNVKDAQYYLVTVETFNEETCSYLFTREDRVNVTAGGKTSFYSFEKSDNRFVTGKYRLTILAANADYEQYPNESARSYFTYEIKDVSVGNVTQVGNTISWAYSALNLSLTVYKGEEQIFASRAYNQTLYVNKTGATCSLDIVVTGGYDDSAHILYLGQIALEPILIDYLQLLTPTLTVTESETGFTWEAVAQASAYEVTVSKDGDVISVSDYDYDTLSYTFATEVGRYVVSISSVDRVGTYKPSDLAVFTYEVKEVALSEFDIVSTGKTAREARLSTAVGKLYCSTDGENYVYTTEVVYAPDDTTHYYVRCETGFVSTGMNEGVYYSGSNKSTDRLVIIPKFLTAPTLTLTQEGVSVSDVDPRAEELILTLDGIASHVDKTSLLQAFSTEIGEHTLKVTAYRHTSDDYEQEYPSDDASQIITYTVKKISLHVASVDTSVHCLEFTAFGLVSVSSAGDLVCTSGEDADSYLYTPSESVTVTVTAARGLDEDHAVYYVGESDLTSSAVKVIIPVQLKAPLLRKDKDFITVLPVTNADGYFTRYSEDGGVTWSEWDSSLVSKGVLSYLGENETTYTVEVKAYSLDSVQYPESLVSALEYTTVFVTLSALQVVENVVSWSGAAYEFSYKIDTSSITGSYTVTSDSSYTFTTEGEYYFRVRARRGFRDTTNTYYHYSKTTLESDGVPVSINKLAAPVVSGSDEGVSWIAVAGAVAYKYKVNNGSFQNLDASVTSKAFSTTKGTYRVEVVAVGDDKTLLSSEVGTYTYTVESVSLSALSVSNRTASWTAVALSTSVRLGSTCVEPNGNSYSLASDLAAGKYTVTVKAEGGFKNNTYYYCAAPIEKSADITLVKLAAPVLSATESALTWSKVSNAASYKSAIDSESSYAANTALSVQYSSSVGSHTIYVKSVAAPTSAYVDSDPAQYSYTTKQSAITILSQTDLQVTWSLVGIKAQYSADNGATWTDTTRSGYTASASSTVKFKAVGGYDVAGKVNYVGNPTISTTFKITGMYIDNFESSTVNSGTVSGWTMAKYTDSGWVANTSDFMTLVSDYSGSGNAVRLTTKADGYSAKITKNLGTMSKAYYGLVFDMKLNALHPTLSATIEFRDPKLGIYFTYEIKNISALSSTNDWYRVYVNFEDPNVKVWFKGNHYTPQKMKENIGRFKEYGTWENAVKSMTEFGFIVTGFDDYRFAEVYFDNFRLIDSTTSSAVKLTTKYANLEFADSTYANNWKKYKWGNGAYSESSDNLLQQQSNGASIAPNNLASMYCGFGDYKYVYTVNSSDKANHLSIDLASWTSGVNINYRIILTDTNNNEIFLAGSATGYAVLTPTQKPSMTYLTYNFNAAKIKNITIIAKANANANLFVDNIYLANSTLRA